MPRALTVLCLACALLSSAGSAVANDLAVKPAGRWLDASLQPLPFTTEEELLDFLKTAPIVETKRLSVGINRHLKVTLEANGVRAHGVFRTVDRNRPSKSRIGTPNRNSDRDSYIFEVAAYEIARLLELDRVPPVVLRKYQGEEGSLQLWLEGVRSEAHRIKAKEEPPQPATWHLQRQLMTVFDNLIYNFDRNPGNVLFDEDGKLWFVDHTRSFKQLPTLISQVSICERSFYNRLKGLDPKLIRQRLRPYLEITEVKALLARRVQLIERLEALIAERGEEGVLFDLQPL